MRKTRKQLIREKADASSKNLCVLIGNVYTTLEALKEDLRVIQELAKPIKLNKD